MSPLILCSSSSVMSGDTDSMPFPLSVQLYSARDPLAVDRTGTLARLAEIGYRAVEAVDLHDDPTGFRKIVDELGISVVSTHAGALLKNDPDDVFDRVAALGTDLANTGASRRRSSRPWTVCDARPTCSTAGPGDPPGLPAPCLGGDGPARPRSHDLHHRGRRASGLPGGAVAGDTSRGTARRLSPSGVHSLLSDRHLTRAAALSG